MQVREPAFFFNRPLVRRKSTTRIILHHTASGDVSAETVHEWHRTRAGFGGIGYHYLIRVDGSIERGRPENTRGVHARGANADSIALALAGNFENHAPTPAQMTSLVWLIRNIRSRLPHWRDLPIVGHSDVTATACPGRLFPWDELRRRLSSAP
jgi:N-acetyl-anhydromuramyl-L-alanine amidase AmpD